MAKVYRLSIDILAIQLHCSQGFCNFYKSWKSENLLEFVVPPGNNGNPLEFKEISWNLVSPW